MTRADGHDIIHAARGLCSLEHFYCLIEELLAYFDMGSQAARELELDGYCRFRDNFLAKSADGRLLAYSYYKFSPEAITLLSQRVDLARRAWDFLNKMGPDLAKVEKYGDAALSPFAAKNLKLASTATLNEDLALAAAYKKYASADLAKTSTGIEGQVRRGLGLK